MNICVAGWYFHKPFMEAVQSSGYNWFFVCHKWPPAMIEDSSIIRNVGLEFGCYDWFLKNRWVAGDTLFTHDDNEITQEALKLISEIEYDQCFLFSNEAEAKANGNAHGRAFFCSEKLLDRMQKDGGFWYDEGPITSMAIPATTADKPDYHNAGISTFRAYLRSLPKEFSVNQIGIVPGLKTGYRGRL